MLSAIIAGIITLIVVVAAAIIFFHVRDKRNQGSSSIKRSVGSVIDTFGVGTSRSSSVMASGDRPTVSHSTSASGDKVSGINSRFTAVAVLLAGVFGTLTAKLWSLQVLEGQSYAEDAQENLYTSVTTPAPRGIIYDADGTVLVDNESTTVVLADADVADDRDVLQRLSVVLGIPFGVVKSRIEDTTNGAQSQRVVASDVKIRDIAFIVEHIDAFTGVTTQSRTKRHYPYGALAAHVLGYTGTATEDQISDSSEGRTVSSGDEVGQSGIEQQYDDLLAGEHGVRQLMVDSSGKVQQVVSETNPTRGNDLYLTIRAQVQMAADNALLQCISVSEGAGTGRAGALVCMDVTNGEIIALSSYPTFNPSNFVGGISQDVWDQVNTDESYYPLMNRVVAGSYPLASTFKTFTGLAGMEYGFADTSTTWTCTGTWDGFGEDYEQDCWEEDGHGTLGFQQAIIESCDTVFYEIAKSFYNASDTIGETAMQDYVGRFGFGTATGIDIDGESSGRIPTPEWKEEYYSDAPEEGQWQPGDMSNMAIGQGYVLGTMLQLAVAYGAVATGGDMVKPHVLKQVRNSDGGVVVNKKGKVTGTVEDLNQDNLDVVKEALRGVVTDNSQVAEVFEGYKVSGKTGTAEQTDKNDHALFACYGPSDEPKYVVTCIIEEGEAGASVAAPVAGKVMKAALKYAKGTLDTEVSAITATYEQRSQSTGTSSGRSD